MRVDLRSLLGLACVAALVSGCASPNVPRVDVGLDPAGKRPPLIAPAVSDADSGNALRAARHRVALQVPEVSPAVLPVFPDPTLDQPLWLVSEVALWPLDEAEPEPEPEPVPEVAEVASRTAVTMAVSRAEPSRESSSSPDVVGESSRPSPSPAVVGETSACEGWVSSPEGYAGAPLAGGARALRRVVSMGDSWWGLGRRFALSYEDLARLNGVSPRTVASGRGLVAGSGVWVVERSGPDRGRAVWFCGESRPVERWVLYPERALWRPAGPLSVSGPGEVPALADPDASWLVWPYALALEGMARMYGLSLAELLRYNGLSPDLAGTTRALALIAVPESARRAARQ